MNDCKACELAVYCYSEPSSWTFRTKEEMEDVQQRILQCETRKQVSALGDIEELSEHGKKTAESVA